MYLGWFDDNPKKAAAEKIGEAVSAYQMRFGVLPNIVLVNREDVAEYPGLKVRAEGYIRRNNFWVGWEDALR